MAKVYFQNHEIAVHGANTQARYELTDFKIANSFIYAIGQRYTVQKGDATIEQAVADSNTLQALLMSLDVYRYEELLRPMLEIIESRLGRGDYDGSADDWESNALHYQSMVLKLILGEETY